MIRVYLENDSVSDFVLAPEVGGGAAGVEEVVGGVLTGDVAEPEVPLGVHRQPGRVGRL